MAASEAQRLPGSREDQPSEPRLPLTPRRPQRERPHHAFDDECLLLPKPLTVINSVVRCLSIHLVIICTFYCPMLIVKIKSNISVRHKEGNSPKMPSH